MIVRERRRIFVNNRWRTLVSIVALAPFLFGASTLYADGYVSIPEPVCTGFTVDGCRLRWTEVPAEDGEAEFQCVQYCPDSNRTASILELPEEPLDSIDETQTELPLTEAPPPAADVTPQPAAVAETSTEPAPVEAPPPPAADVAPQPAAVAETPTAPADTEAPPPSVAGVAPQPSKVADAAAPAASEQEKAERSGCELVVHADPGLKGVSAPTVDDQPTLGDEGWQNEIASIEIKSGRWDFFTQADYGGEMMRLGPGSYSTLDPKWSKHIGSFMCSQPAAETASK